jgi:hypothetical protein
MQNDIEAYQKLLAIFTSDKILDFKSIVIRISQVNPVAVVNAIKDLDSNPLVEADNDEKFISETWERNNHNLVLTIKALRERRSNRGRERGVNVTSQEGMDRFRIGLKNCKDDVEAVIYRLTHA